MSELTETQANHSKVRFGFMAGVSTLALLSAVCLSRASESDGEDRPAVWIELGGQLERVNGANAPFSPDFLERNSESPVFKPVSPLQAQRSPRYSLGEEGEISFQPAKSKWVFSAGVRYGRSNGTKDLHYQTEGLTFKSHVILNYPPATRTARPHDYSEVQSRQQENHLIVDFRAGRDVGLGFWKSGSDISLGIRFAQFTSKADVHLRNRPDVTLHETHPLGNPQKYQFRPYYHEYVLAGQAALSFHGIGPSLSWNGVVTLLTGERDAHLDVDMGANGAILFGRQKANATHQTVARYFTLSEHDQYIHSGAPARSRSVTVPNIGAFAGLSYRIDSFKMSAGYRADFFFGAMDTGIDSPSRSKMSFHGPFATVGIGLGG